MVSPVLRTKAKAPLPMGACANGGVGGTASADSRGTTDSRGLASAAGREDQGWSRMKCTTSGRGVVIPISSGAVPSTAKGPNPLTGSRRSAPGDPEPRRATLSSEYLTSDEVMVRPLLKRASARRKKDQLRWSCE